MDDRKKGFGPFWNVAVGLCVVFTLIVAVIPWISRVATGMDLPLPVPSTLVIFYSIIILLGTAVYVTSDEEYLEEFLEPVKKLFRAKYGSGVRVAVLLALPFLFGLAVFLWVRPTVSSPVLLRIQHPSSNFPKKYETMVNPMRHPADAEIDEFIEQVKSDSVRFLPQVHERGRKFTNIGFIPKKPVRDFLQKLEKGEIDRGLAREALLEKRLFEGRALYEINCRPCHGDSTAGDGPMAYGFKLRPLNFDDIGTIEVLVEGYTFWRVSTGGLGLPPESTGWDSAMPVWEMDLSEKERWTAIMGVYNLARKSPRIPEKPE